VHNLGLTRSAYRSDHLLLTPDTFVRAPLPGMKNATAVVHVSPARGAAFTMYTAEFEPSGELGPAATQRFLYVLDGYLRIHVAGRGHDFGPRGFFYAPANTVHQVTAQDKCRAIVIEKPYISNAGVPPPAIVSGSEESIPGTALNGDPALLVRGMLPDSPAFDFAVNTMTYQPGAALSMVEMHVMEHGLLMLEGGGIYRLGDSWYPVAAGDFIWMGPWCPQWFGAIGKTPAKYLIYKDWNRHPLAELTP
jgi:(S)-ureidoglycine aminohydrolase